MKNGERAAKGSAKAVKDTVCRGELQGRPAERQLVARVDGLPVAIRRLRPPVIPVHHYYFLQMGLHVC